MKKTNRRSRSNHNLLIAFLMVFILGTTGYLTLIKPLAVKAGTSPLLISEVKFTGEVGGNYVELYNRSGSALSTEENVGVQYKFPSGEWTNLHVAFSNESIPASGFVLFGTAGGDLAFADEAAFNTAMAANNNSINGLSLRLCAILSSCVDGNLLDVVGFGSSSTTEGTAISLTDWDPSKSFERKAIFDSTVGAMIAGGEDETAGNGFDSDDNNWDFVMQSTGNPQNLSSAVESLDNAVFEDVVPFIDHGQVFSYHDNADLYLFAAIYDDSNIATTGAKIFYRVGTSGVFTQADSTKTVGAYDLTGSAWYAFVIPQASLQSAVSGGGVVQYYLQVTDGENTATMPDYNPSTTPFNIGVTDDYAGVKSFSGVITDSQLNFVRALVLIENSGFYAVSSAENGAYSFSSLPTSYEPDGAYRVIMVAPNYSSAMVSGMNGSTTVNAQLPLSYGDFGGGDFVGPYVNYTAPNAEMFGAPVAICNLNTSPESLPAGVNFCSPIMVGFSEAMNSGTVNTTNVKLYNFTTSAYVDNLGITATAQDNEFQVFSTTPLSVNTTYALILTTDVRDQAGNALVGNRSDGSYEITFTTGGAAFTGGGGQTFGSGQFQPPFVRTVSPNSGSFNIAMNANVLVDFTTAVNVESANLARVNLVDLDSSEVVSLTRTYSNDKTKIILNPNSTLSANQDYEIRVAGSFESSVGVTLGDPQNSQNTDDYVFFRSSFTTGSTLDSTGPRVLGTLPASAQTDVAVGLGSIEIGVSESLDAATVNTSNVTFKRGSTNIAADIEYDEASKTIRLFPSSALTANASHTVAVKTDVTDINGNAFNSDNDGTNGEVDDIYTFQFTTSSTIETTAPTVTNVRCDDYQCVVTYSEAMNRVTVTDTTDWVDSVGKWETSVLNRLNYSISVDKGAGLATVDITEATFKYDGNTNSVIISNLRLYEDVVDLNNPVPLTLSVYNAAGPADGVRDIVGNVIAASISISGTVESSAQTQGFIGPGATGFGTSGVSDFGMHSAATMGEKPIGVFPMNSLAGVTSRYFVDLPVTTVIPNGGKIELTFPNGFDITNAVIDTNSPMNNDISRGSSTMTLSCVGTQATRTITCTTTGASDANDYLSFELKTIINSSIPKDFNTSGYTVDVKTKSADGLTLLESMTTMPFFVTAAGSNSITVKVYAGGQLDATTGTDDIDDVTMNLFVGSPMTGPMDQTITFTNGYATTTISNLPAGEYFVFTEPSMTIGANEYVGVSPEQFSLNNNVTKSFSLSKMDNSTAAPLTVKITGAFGETEDIDIFAGSSKGFVVKTISDIGTVTNQSYTLYLPYNSDWSIGLGPAMPKGAISGQVAMPDWMPPKNKMVRVTGVGETVALTNMETQADVTSAGVSFTVASADYQINGSVVDGNDQGIANAELWAYQPMGFGGSGNNTRATTGGNFSLKVAEYGTYKVGAFLPGIPQSPELTLEVKVNTGAIDGNASADVYLNGTLITAGSPFKIKLRKADYTISGKVTDSSNNPMQYAPIWAEESTTKQTVNAMTDSSGNYVLYVGNGTWVVRSAVPFGSNICGSLTKTVTISSASKSGQNLQPSSSTCYTLSGTVTIGGSVVTGAPVFIDEWSGTLASGNPIGVFRDSRTDSAGQYSTRISNGTYRVGTWSEDYGERAILVTVNGQDSTANHITVEVADLKTLTVNFTGGASDMTGFMEVRNATSTERRGRPINDLSNAEIIQVSAGTYNVFVHIDGVGDFSQSSVDLTANAVITFNVSSVTRFGITGTVEDVDGNPIESAWVWVHDPNSNYRTGAATNSSGAYTLSVKEGSGMKIGVDKPNYVSPAPRTLNVTEAATIDFTDAENAALTATNYVVSGTVTGTNLTEGFVWAETATGGWSGSPIDLDGTFSLPVTNGTWTLKGIAPLHAQTTYSGSITINNDSVTGLSFPLTVDVTKTVKTAINSITPSVGGVIQDDTVGAKVVVPPNALGSGSTSGNMTMQKSYTAPATGLYAPLSGESVNISVTDNNGQQITNLNDDVELTLDYLTTSLPSGISEGDLIPAYWDTTTNQWIPLSGVQNSSDNSFTAQTNHFTIFGVVYSPLSVTTASGSSRSSQEASQELVDSITGDGSGSSTSIPATEETTEPETAEPELIPDESVTETPETSVEAEEEMVKTYTPDLPAERDLDNERDAISRYISLEKELPTGDDWKVVQFISYGSTSVTEVLTTRERSGLVSDYKDLYGHLPVTETDWKDIDLIARGEQPTRILTLEASAIKEFVMIYGRLVNFQTAADEDFIHMVAYRYRVEQRDLARENTALGIFSKAYGHLPNSTHFWSVLRAISYANVE